MITPYMKKLSFNLILVVIVHLLFSSCDPSCDGIMKITNNTENTLTLVIEKGGDFKDESIHFLYQVNENSQSTFIGDTLLIVECSLTKNQELELYYEGAVGTLSLDDKESAHSCLNEISDTIYLKNFSLEKDVENMDNWDITVDKYKNGGGESLFEFIITEDDIKN